MFAFRNDAHFYKNVPDFISPYCNIESKRHRINITHLDLLILRKINWNGFANKSYKGLILNEYAIKFCHQNKKEMLELNISTINYVFEALRDNIYKVDKIEKDYFVIKFYLYLLMINYLFEIKDDKYYVYCHKLVEFLFKNSSIVSKLGWQ